MQTRLGIKNMVCSRCIRVVNEELGRIGVDVAEIRLGEVVVPHEIHPEKLEEIRSVLETNGFELIDDKKRLLIERVKILIINLIQHGDEETLASVLMSQYLASQLQTEYSHISTLFSQLEGITLEKFVILQKIERVKELMMYNEMNISEISYKLGYSSVHHLSNQFKKVTGMTPTEFKRLQTKPRVGLDRVQQKQSTHPES